MPSSPHTANETRPDHPAAAACDPGAVPWSTVLCVDDEPHILAALKRVLRGAGLCVLTAQSGAQAMAMLEEMPVDLMVCDMRMPQMDGATLLAQAHQRWPHMVRVLLTGHADMQSTVAAINHGQVFRYLQKPWDDAELLATVQQGLERLALQRETQRLEALTQQQNGQLQALNAELEARVQTRTAALKEANDKLQTHYLKSIKVFSNLLELRSGLLAGHGRRVADAARDTARHMGLAEDVVRQVFVAGLLHDVGLIGVGDKLLANPVAKYLPEELALYRDHPVQGEQVLLALDDMQPLLPVIRAHHERFDGRGFPDQLSGTAIPLAARILTVADAFDDLQHGNLLAQTTTRAEARKLLAHGRGSQFDPEVLDVFLRLTEPEQPRVHSDTLLLHTRALESDMVLARDLVSSRGVLMLTNGHRLNAALIRRIRDFEKREGSQLEVHIRP